MKFLENLFAILNEIFSAAGSLCWAVKEILRYLREIRENGQEPDKEKD